MYKRVPCRHFDPSSGKPLSPCTQGENCRFIHPGEPNWRNVKKEKNVHKTPLAAQQYAFRRHQRELSPSPRPYDPRHFTRLEDMSRPPNASDRDLRVDCHRGEAFRSDHRQEVQQKDATQGIVKTEEIHGDQKEALHMPKKTDEATVKQVRSMNRMGLDQGSPGQVWNAFLEIARLTRETDILAEQQKQEETKLATYAAVEKTLNEISNQMGLAVVPQIDQSTVIQQDCKKTIAENNETVNKLCKNVVQYFVADVNNAVDKHLHTAVQKIRDEADNLSREMQKRKSPGDTSWWAGQARRMGRSWSPQDFDIEARRMKRRRMRTPSPYSGSASREAAGFMRELEAKIERQAQALINLGKENEKLRAQNLKLRTPARGIENMKM